MTILISFFPSPPFFFPYTAECLTIIPSDPVRRTVIPHSSSNFLERLEIYSNPGKISLTEPFSPHKLTTEMSSYLRKAVLVRAVGQSVPLTKTLHVVNSIQSHDTDNNWCLSPREHVEGLKVCLTDVQIDELKIYHVCSIPELNQTQARDH